MFAFRGRVMSLLELTLCGVSSTTHFPQESHRFPPPLYFMSVSKTTSGIINFYAEGKE
ncbi:hypothetical protein SAMN05421677_10977 [Halobacillus aidingensis]|uniref:Uncharacterized protein n=1 Tax=Halobacillus aidingensis TaxID=240303 RepID=A0A1H0NH03_HALAD|nr:hypothetical protein SAMN05421677_10977 [Halobacillus aidingensis]